MPQVRNDDSLEKCFRVLAMKLEWASELPEKFVKI